MAYDPSELFTLQADKLIDSVLSDHKDRNNLAVAVENGTGWDFKMDFYAEHGNISVHPANNDLPGGGKPANVWEIGAVAAGEGCNLGIVLKINGANEWYVIEVATPSNKDNYMRGVFTQQNQGSTEAFWELADDKGGDKHYSSEGIFNLKGIMLNINATMSGDSPAACLIEVEPAAA